MPIHAFDEFEDLLKFLDLDAAGGFHSIMPENLHRRLCGEFAPASSVASKPKQARQAFVHCPGVPCLYLRKILNSNFDVPPLLTECGVIRKTRSAEY